MAAEKHRETVSASVPKLEPAPPRFTRQTCDSPRRVKAGLDEVGLRELGPPPHVSLRWVWQKAFVREV